MLRILSMYFVLVLHVGGFVFLPELKDISVFSCFGWLIEYLAIVAVNCFVLITGYVYIDKKNSLGRIFSLWFQVFFYSVLLAAFCFVVGKKITSFELPKFTDISKIDFISSFFPVFRKRYWFFTEYCGLLVLMPMLSGFVKNADRTNFRNLLLCGFICFSVFATLFLTDVFNLGSGYSTLWFVYLYLCGAYIKLYKKDYKSTKYLVVYFVAALLSAMLRIFLEYSNIIVIGHNVNKLGRFVSNYNSPLVFISSIALFLFFQNINVKNIFLQKLIFAVSPLCFSVYLIHLHINFGRPWFAEDNFVKEFLYSKGMQNIGCFLLIILGMSFIIFVICCVLDFVRHKVFQMLGIKRLCNIVGNSVTKVSSVICNRFIDRV